MRTHLFAGLIAAGCTVASCGSPAELPTQNPPRSVELGPNGAALAVGNLKVVLPPGLFDFEARDVGGTLPTIALSAIGSLKDRIEADSTLDPGGDLRLLGHAYRLDTAVYASSAIEVTVAYDPSQIPTGAAPENIALVAETIRLSPLAKQGDLVGYSLLPVVVDAAKAVVRFKTSTAATFQLAVLREPLDCYPKDGGAAPAEHADDSGVDARRSALKVSSFDVEVVFTPNCGVAPVIRPSWADVLRDALATSNKKLKSLGFPVVDEKVRVIVAKQDPTANWIASTGVSGGTFEIEVDIKKWVDRGVTTEDFQKAIAHEVFHVVQGQNSNLWALPKAERWESYLHSAWFMEGTAEWAADEVYDAVEAPYHAPTGARFQVPLNKKGPGTFTYSTVAFWKWVERESAKTIVATIKAQAQATGFWFQFKPGVLVRVNNLMVKPNYMADLLGVTKAGSPPDFLEFATEALVFKRFDPGEKGEWDLWHSSRLGPPMALPGDPVEWSVPEVLSRGGDGGSAERKLETYRALTTHLTASAARFQSAAGAQAISGRLHVVLTPPTSKQKHVGFCLVSSTAASARCVKAVEGKKLELDVPLPAAGTGEVFLILADLSWPTIADPLVKSEARYMVHVAAWVESAFPFITQDEVLLEGRTQAGLELEAGWHWGAGGAGWCAGVSALFQEMNTGYQRTKGRFVDQRGHADGSAVNYVRVRREPGVRMYLTMPGKVEETAHYYYWSKESNPGVEPTTWEIFVSHDRAAEVNTLLAAGQPAAPMKSRDIVWPRYLEVWTTVGAKNVERRVPLIWWRYTGTNAISSSGNAYEPPPNQHKLACHVQMERHKWFGELFFGDGDVYGQDTGSFSWTDPSKIHTAVGFIPVKTVGGHPVGPIAHSKTQGGCTANKLYYRDLFSRTKNRLEYSEAVAAPGSDCVGLPSLPGPIADVTFKRDYIMSSEQQLFAAHGVEPLEYEITLRAK